MVENSGLPLEFRRYVYETLYIWRFKFHKVVRQQNSGADRAVEEFILSILQFIYESKSERIIEICPHLPKLSQK